MVIVREKRKDTAHEESLEDLEKQLMEATGKEYDYLLHKTLAKLFGCRPLSRPDWEKGFIAHRRRVIPFMRRISSLP